MIGAKAMKNLTGNEIRQRFLDFFAQRGHLVLQRWRDGETETCYRHQGWP